ncbi:hypothetical protein D2T29_12860 [Sinirhodobacter populi]|uniref:Pilus assembly protein n=1 Tax=Paenirhodobacter populi TaxID=2306993 RepID=A0A443KCY4_9RHOB|nr:TraE/TraK family type IV conjugative transfer system protein [Sinirhodobacter populi]RWR30556.1 hypothetical protein D2T29_12860 [Sinirhodobacter populi]
MKKPTAIKTVRQLKVDNTILKIGIGASMIALASITFVVATRDEAVILVPPFQNADIEFVNGRANQEYYSQWAWSVAMLTGNLTPGNAAFVRNQLQSLATPGLYRKMMETVAAELQQVVRDNAVITFSPRDIIFDPELNHFFVTGAQEAGGPGVKNPARKQLTYELGFTTERLRVSLNYYDVYEGKPRTAKVRETEQQNAARKERDAKEREALQ